MHRLITLLALAILTTTTSLQAADPFGLSQKESQIFVNNRILATVNGKAISVIDVMKKMDMQFYKQYPQYIASAPARFQYYQAQWQGTLQEMIDKELVLADSEELKLPISHGDIRQEMENLFGPNIILSLDKVGLTYNEAWTMVEEDMRLQRMIYLRANAKAVRTVNPQAIRAAYEEFAKSSTEPESWEYSSITIRHPDPVIGAEVANFVYQQLQAKDSSLEQLQNAVNEVVSFKEAKLSASEKLKQNEKELNPDNKIVLNQLNPNQYSLPIAQQSRREKATLYRIFKLFSYHPAGAPPFNEVEGRIRNLLISKASNIETDAYLKRLRAHYHVDEKHIKQMRSDDFAPFVLW